ncbi:hypothetical protein F2Q69_00033043 [Brassica cretica]|uniref:Uncharacterized protein n=1 Tax=Brassica cretica TaxID=69181 RepID=A0A8S9SMI2_BRACR|nr:hypothetical protein F2Q69_00033043 [Brassica cretica]
MMRFVRPLLQQELNVQDTWSLVITIAEGSLVRFYGSQNDTTSKNDIEDNSCFELVSHKYNIHGFANTGGKEFLPLYFFHQQVNVSGKGPTEKLASKDWIDQGGAVRNQGDHDDITSS